jgi:hypothetical protein
MASERTDFDQALKRMLLRAHDGFLALVAPDLAWIGERSPELPAAARQADLVWEVMDNLHRRGLANVELQVKIEADIIERLVEYAIRLWRRDGLPVRTIVIFLRPGSGVPVSPFVLDWMGEEILRYHFTVIKLWEIPPERVLDTPYAPLWPLVGVMGEGTVESVLRAGEKIASAPLPREERSELATLLATLAGIRHPRGIIREALRGNTMLNELLRESSVVADWRDEGRAEGRAEGLRVGVRLALTGRFGPADERLQAAIANADEDALEAVLAHIGGDTQEEILSRLIPVSPNS